jgi:hypothetical protein
MPPVIFDDDRVVARTDESSVESVRADELIRG